GRARGRGSRHRPRDDGPAVWIGSAGSVLAVALAAILLAPQRACYIATARAPDAFLRLCARWRWLAAGGPTAVVERLFYLFKGLQLTVFIAWCYVHGGGFPLPVLEDPFVVALAGVLVV